MSKPPSPKRSSALLISAGIFLSRVIGLVRERAFAHYLGTSDAADVFRAAFRIPNLLQNLLGEGALSAAFVPVYARLIKEDPKRAQTILNLTLTLLSALVASLVFAGWLGSRFLVTIVAPGFTGEKQTLAIELVRILFPGLGLLVISALLLGVLNSHRRFFMPYAAPVVWSLAMIAALVGFASDDLSETAVYLAWGATFGSVLQILIQLPSLFGVLDSVSLSFQFREPELWAMVQRLLPQLMSKGVLQLSAYLDSMIASFLVTGSVALLGYSQLLVSLPASLFGVALSTTHLVDSATRVKTLESDLSAALRRMAFFIVPCAIAFVVLGDLLAGVVFRTGAFGDREAKLTWFVLAGYAVSLVFSTQSRLLANSFFVLHDTKTPLFGSSVRVMIAAACSAALALSFSRLGLPAELAVAGIALGSSAGAALERLLLIRFLEKRGFTPKGLKTPLFELVACSLLAASLGRLSYEVLSQAHLPHLVVGVIALSIYGAGFAALCLLRNIPEAKQILHRLRAR